MKRTLLSFMAVALLSVSNLSAQKEDRVVGASLSGDNIVPTPITSSGSGTVTGVLKNDWTEFHYVITIDGLTPSVAHFHNGPFDETGGVVKTLDFTGGMTISGVWSSSDGDQPFTTAMLDELLAGRIYVNIHTTENSGGEIRGNIQVPVFFKVLLSGDKIVPTPITSSGVGTGVAILFGNDRELDFGLNVTGLTPINSHFHNASATETGGVVKNITLVDDAADGEWFGSDAEQPLTDVLIDELLLENLYFNIHTAAYSGGEIRGQLEREDATAFAAFISGDNISPTPISSLGTGLAFLSLNSARTAVEYDITISSITQSVAHFHNAGAGLNGGVVKTLDFVDGHASGVWSSTDGDQPLTSDLVEELLSGRLYVNIHTTEYSGGEIRGQVFVVSGYSAQLDGSQTVADPAVVSSGTGTLTSLFFYSDDGAELEYNITVNGLTITNSHFHAGAAGENGGVIKAITFDGNSASGIWTADDEVDPLTDDIVDMIRSGGVYVNIHTSDYSGGEIRGQLLQGIIAIPVGVVDEDAAQLPTNVQLIQNYPNPFNPETVIRYSIPKAEEVSLVVYNLIGEEVAHLINEQKPAGNYTVEWNASDFASGIYFYRLQAGDFVQTRKMVLLK